MSYLLFIGFDNDIGLFRYKNQAGLETEPLEKMGWYVAFQLNSMMLGLVIEKMRLLKR